MPAAPSVVVRSAIPGRVRWDIAALLDDPRLASHVERSFARQAGVVSVSANPRSGRLLLRYELTRPLSELQAVLVEILRDRPARGEDSAPAPPRPLRSQGNFLLDLIAGREKLRRQATVAITVAFVDRMFEALPIALIGVGVDILVRGPSSFIGRLGFTTLRSQLAALGGLGAVTWTLDSLMSYAHSRTSAELASTVRQQLRSEIYASLQRMDLSRIESRALTDWLSVLQTDVSRIADFLEEGLDPIVTMLTNGIIVATTFIRYSPLLALVQFLSIPGLYLVSTQMLRPMRERRVIARRDEERLSATLHANLSGMPVVASYVRQESEAARIDELGQQAGASARHLSKLSAAYVPALQMVVGVGYIGSLVYGGALVARGAIPIAGYNMMANSSLRFLSALGRLGISVEHYQRTKLAVNRVVEVLAAQPDIRDGSRVPDPAGVTREIAFDNVVFGYAPERPVLRALSLQFPSKKITGIVGASGAGKTTILKLILRFYDVQSGAVTLDGTDIRDFQVDALRGLIAQVPQQPFLFPGTLRDNIAYGRPEASIDEVIAAARIAEADEFVRSLPDGYDSVIGARNIQLSAGQQQRLAIARAVLADRPILVFDEATSAIDYETEAAIQRSLESVMAGRTTIVVAHRLSTIRHADQIYVIGDGQVREHGRHDDLVRLDGIYAGMWRVQTGERPTPTPAPTRTRKPASPKPRARPRRK